MGLKVKHSTSKPTKAEVERIEAMMVLGCVHCAWWDEPVPAEECHHILRGNKRLGHWYTLPLCKTCHASINQLTNPLYSDVSEQALWERVQNRLHLPTDWPESKILPRKTA
jgi:hypothetical protein